MLEAANWTCHILGCRDVIIDGLKIKNTARANRDGLDIDSSSYVTVTNCRISSQDDALVIKSTGADKAQNITIQSENPTSSVIIVKVVLIPVFVTDKSHHGHIHCNNEVPLHL